VTSEPPSVLSSGGTVAPKGPLLAAPRVFDTVSPSHSAQLASGTHVRLFGCLGSETTLTLLLVHQVLTACVHTFEGPAFGSRLPRSRLSPTTRLPLPSLHPLPAVSLVQARGTKAAGSVVLKKTRRRVPLVALCDTHRGPFSRL
jgi:hypothetical protein